jgi:hypothetical protein
LESKLKAPSGSARRRFRENAAFSLEKAAFVCERRAICR